MPGPFRRLRRGGAAARILADATRLSGRLSQPPAKEFASLVSEVSGILAAEPEALRPHDLDGLPGGLLDLPDLPIVLLPDLHTRTSFLAAALSWRLPLGAAGPSLAELLEREEAVLVCLGDAFHSEGEGAALRWRLAEREYLSGWSESQAMDEEMGRALACVELVLRLKRAFPSSFHYLKGNHDNIVNEEGHGDHPFYKFAMEGEMAASWFLTRYGGELASAYRGLELSLPVAVRGARFAASHAEPAFDLAARDIIEYRHRPDVAEALTWTPNDGAAEGSVARSLAALLGPGVPGARWYGGHRPVDDTYRLRAKGHFVQFHNPGRWPVALIRPGLPPDPELAISYLDY